MVELSRDVLQTLRRTRREAEAVLGRAEEQAAALRTQLEQLPADMRAKPEVRAALARLEQLEVYRSRAFHVLAAGRVFEG